MKTCSICKVEKDINSFGKVRKRKETSEYYRRTFCKKCEWFKKRDSKREYDLKRLFGINLEIYNKYLIDQNFSCAICKKHISFFNKQFCVDHNHTSGKIRGLLCGLCNKGLGMMFDDQAILQNAIIYLNERN